MIRAEEIWHILSRYMQQGKWMDLDEVYTLVKSHGQLDQEDCNPSAPGNSEPKWKRNVRNVIQRRKRLGHLDWDGRAHYRLIGGVSQ